MCGQTSFISDMKLYTISLQNPNKKTHLKTLVVPHWILQGLHCTNFEKHSLVAMVDVLLLLTSSSSGSLWMVKVTNFNWGSNFCTTLWLKRVTSFVRDSNCYMVHFFQCQFLWIYDFVENLFHVSLLLKRYNLFDTIFLILRPVSILTDNAIV